MNMFSNLSNDDNGIYYDSTSGRLYQKEVTWECEQYTPQPTVITNVTPTIQPQTITTTATEMPLWFKEWINKQTSMYPTTSTEMPLWFKEWVNKQVPQVYTVPQPQPVYTTTSEMPLWFKEWLNRQSPTPGYYYPPSVQPQPPPGQTQAPSPPQTLPQPPVPGQTQAPIPQPVPGQTPLPGYYPQGYYPPGYYPPQPIYRQAESETHKAD